MEYNKRPENFVALNLLKSWAKAMNLPVTPKDDSSHDLRLNDRPVAVRDWSGVKDGIVGVESKILTSSSVHDTQTAFRGLLGAVGLPEQDPPFRLTGIEVKENGRLRRASHRDDLFLSVIRKNEFVRAVNPDPAKLEKYKPLVKNTVNRFLASYGTFARDAFDAGYESSDVVEVAMVWVVNFCSQFELEEDPYNENFKLLASYIKQRLSELATVLRKKRREFSLSEDSLYSCNWILGTTGPEEPQPAKAQIDLSSKSARKASSKALLQRLLDELPHDVMLNSLTEVEGNGFWDVSTRNEARRQLNRHRASCVECGGTQTDDPSV